MTDDALVIFTPSGKRGRFALGTPVLTAARQLGVDLDSVCGGRGICSKCQITPGVGAFPKHGVTVSADALSEWNAVEQRYKDKRGMIDGRRLGCQAKVMGDVVIDVPPESQLHRQVVRKAASARAVQMDPATRLYYVEVAEPDMHEPSGDLERLSAALRDQWQIDGVEAGPLVLRKLQPVLRKGNWAVTVAVFRDHHGGPARVLDVFPGFHDGTLAGLAIDLGSTTIAAHLCDLRDGRVNAVDGFGGEHEPHVQRVLAAVIVRHFPQGIDLRADRLEARLRHRHRRQHKAPAHALDVIHRPEARQHAPRQHVLEPRQQGCLGHAEAFGHVAVGRIAERETALQGVDDAPVRVGQRDRRLTFSHGAPRRRHSARPAA